MDKTPAPLLLAWRSFWVLKKHRPEPVWARLLISGALGVAIGLLLLGLGGLFSGHGSQLAWWRAAVLPWMLIALCISYTVHALYRSIELLLSEARLVRINAWRDWRSGVFFSAMGMIGTVAGGALALLVIGAVSRTDILALLLSRPQAALHFLLVGALISLLNWFWWKLRWRQQALKLQATEAQLRLLQAQIEPHFLFNTLANVQSLIDHDTPRAKAMLESFTDYLRASLGQLRRADSTLGAELEMSASYLLLMQTRMGTERLRFEIEADPSARAAVLPPLLLQPLIENAIHHGLEPKVEGGCVRISAAVDAGLLRITVYDDGLGLDAPRRPGRPGQGMALGNVRARLLTRYADNASLLLQPLQPGTRAVLTLPYTAKP